MKLKRSGLAVGAIVCVALGPAAAAPAVDSYRVAGLAHPAEIRVDEWGV